MKITILTLFPEMFKGVLKESIVKRAQEKGVVEIEVVNFRQFAEDKHSTVDDTPYGGGAGMVLKVDVMDRAIQESQFGQAFHKILMTPQGKPFDQEKAKQLAKLKNIMLICGHYEGFDERIREYLIDEEISLGDFVLSGGEIPAMAVLDAVIRLIPGALGKDESAEEETFSINDKKLLEYPQYTRPIEYKGWKVPEVLTSGNHAEIKKWRLEKAVEKTKKNRPELFKEIN